MTPIPPRTASTAAAQLRTLVARLPLPQQRLLRAARTAIRRRFPTANELVYDYGRFVVLSYSPTARGIDAVVALAGRPDGVLLYLNQGPALPDPHGLLRGSGKATRYLPIANGKQLAYPHVRALLTAAAQHARARLPATGVGQMLVVATAAGKAAGRAKPKRSNAKAPAPPAPAPARRAAARAKPATAGAR
ncbi:MAG: hypothetical protein ACK5S5_10775 [Planctomycetota bacterium]